MHAILYFFCLHVLFSKILLNCYNPATFYWSACNKLENWAVMYICVFDLILICSKDYNIDICCFSAKLYEERAKTGWIGITIICPCGATRPPMICCFWFYKKHHRIIKYALYFYYSFAETLQREQYLKKEVLYTTIYYVRNVVMTHFCVTGKIHVSTLQRVRYILHA